MLKISLFGLGYVGAVTAGCLARRGHTVLGVDPQEKKIDSLNRGRSPIVEPGLDELIAEGHRAGTIRATTDPGQAVHATEVSLICVGTPSLASGALDTRHVDQVSAQIAAAIAEKQQPHTVIFRSTMLPGSTRRLFEKYFADLQEYVRVFFYPEFLREGTAIRDFAEPSLSAIGVGDGSGEEVIADLNELWPHPPEVVNWETAELLKYACNAFHATKVDFANEIGRISKTIGIDGQRVMQLLCLDEVLNISKYYMRPGNPFGGSCLPKDVSALEIFGQSNGVALPLIENLKVSNQRHLQHLLALVEEQAAETNTVTIIGLAFKANTDDLRGSAMVELASELVLRGYTVRAFDPRVEPARLIGANEKLAERKLPGLETLLEDDLATALGETGVIVAFNKCVETEELLPLLKTGHHVIDVNGWRELKESAAGYEGLCW